MAEPPKRLTAKRPQVARATQPPDVVHHRFEDYLANPYVRAFLKLLTDREAGGKCFLEEVFETYDSPDLGVLRRLKYFIPHQVIELFRARAGVSRELLREKLFHHPPTARALINTARSIAAYGLTTPQRFVAPLMVVWNITQACNLACKHCYQDATRRPRADELSLEGKRQVLDQMAESDVPLVAFAGGEPLVCKDIWRVLEHCRKRQIHVSVATNGTMLSREVCQRLAGCGVKYVEVSLDSHVPAEHDNLRGLKGAWARSVQGIQNVARTPGLRAGMATCFTRQNAHQADAVIQLARDLGCATFVHFNFIPVGRGREVAAWDLTPAQRETLLATLNRHLQEGQISIMSTAPQFGRACLLYGPQDGLMATGHAGSGKGKQARVLSKYIGGCGAGRCYCSVQPNGQVTPCVFMPSDVVGDLRRQSFEQIWRNPLFELLADRDDRGDHCGVCDFRHFCGGCRARALFYTGDVQAGDPGCVHNADVWAEILNDTAAAEVMPGSNSYPDNLLHGATSGVLPNRVAAPDVLVRELQNTLETVVRRVAPSDD